MQYQNENTIRELVSIARGQVKTLLAICDRIDLELDKPALHTNQWLDDQVVPVVNKKLTAKQQETLNCLKGRTKPVQLKRF